MATVRITRRDADTEHVVEVEDDKTTVTELAALAKRTIDGKPAAARSRPRRPFGFAAPEVTRSARSSVSP